MKNSSKVLIVTFIGLLSPACSLLSSLANYPLQDLHEYYRLTESINPWHPFRTQAEWKEAKKRGPLLNQEGLKKALWHVTA